MTLVERPPKLSNTERRVLCELYERDLTSHEVDDLLNVAHGHGSGCVQGLRRKGLVEKVGSKWRAT